jgi:hypothetical protein
LKAFRFIKEHADAETLKAVLTNPDQATPRQCRSPTQFGAAIL